MLTNYTHNDNSSQESKLTNYTHNENSSQESMLTIYTHNDTQPSRWVERHVFTHELAAAKLTIQGRPRVSRKEYGLVLVSTKK